MAEKAKNVVGNELGCGFMGRISQLYKLRKSSVHSLPMNPSNNVPNHSTKNEFKRPSIHEPKCVRKMPTETPLLKSHKPNSYQKPARKSTSSHRTPSGHRNDHSKKPSDAARSSTSSSGNSSHTIGNSLELARISNKSAVKETNNLRLTGNLLVNNSPRISTRSPPKNRELNSMINCQRNANRGVMGNIMRKNSDEFAQFQSPRKKVDPEMLKSMGNEAYKQARYDKALALYDQAIALDSNKATYHCNKSAALIGLGRLWEATVECEEAIRLDFSYTRAHHRLATLYTRLGEAEEALNHCDHTTPYADSLLAFQAQALQNHLKKCIEAREVKDWKTVLKEAQSAISLGADSAPRVYALQAEALLKLLRHPEAFAIYQKIPKFAFDWCSKHFGLADSAYLLMIGAQVNLATGRFEGAVTAAEQAVKLDPSNKEVSAVLKRARAVTSARMSGNLLFKASKFMEACAVYNEGLEQDAYNSVLLCNRAACRSKLGQFEKAIEDCNAALTVQPTYSKARLRRADCNAKLERWEAAIQDYEMLIREKPGDEEVARALFEAQLQLKMLRGEDIKGLKFGSNLVFISSNDRFRHYVTSPGMTVVLFCNKQTNKQILLVLEQTCKRFPSVNFLKVEIEDHPYLVKSEGVNSVPTFKIYKNGSRVKEIPGKKHELLERSVKLYSS